MDNKYKVYVDSLEVSQGLLTKDEAEILAFEFKLEGFINLIIKEVV